MPFFDEESNKLIRVHMEEYGNCHDRFEIVSRLIPKFPEYTPKQISKQWKNHLDPRLCHKPLRKDEKRFVTKWVLKHRTSNIIIHWEDLIDELEKIFGNRHAENKVKKYWRRKSHLRKARSKEKQEARPEARPEEQKQEARAEARIEEQKQEARTETRTEEKQEARTETRIEEQLDSSGYSKIPIL